MQRATKNNTVRHICAYSMCLEEIERVLYCRVVQLCASSLPRVCTPVTISKPCSQSDGLLRIKAGMTSLQNCCDNVSNCLSALTVIKSGGEGGPDTCGSQISAEEKRL